MSFSNTGRRMIRPTQPGEMLREDFLPDYALSASPGMALRLARLFGNSAEFWLNTQRAVDLWDAAQTIKEQVRRIKPLKAA